jgi:hypothetical protein
MSKDERYAILSGPVYCELCGNTLTVKEKFNTIIVEYHACPDRQVNNTPAIASKDESTAAGLKGK